MLQEILNKLNPKDLLAASEVCRYWRDVSSPVIADSVYMVIESMDQAINILSNTSVCYKHFLFVSFLLLLCNPGENWFIYNYKDLSCYDII